MNRKTFWLLLGVFCVLAGQLTAFANQHEICFYVERPFTILGVPVGSGHAFLEMRGLKGRLMGQTFTRGFYPAGRNIFGGAGRVKNDAGHPWHFRICYPRITARQWNAVARGINNKQATPPNYHLLNFNCANWITQKANLVPLNLPVKRNRVNVADPNAFWQSLRGIGHGGMFGGGTVTENPNPPVPPAAGGGPSCSDFGFEELEGWGHRDPEGLAAAAQLPLQTFDLGTVMARPTQPLPVSVMGTTPSEALISIDWGDNSPYEAQQLSFSHTYPVGTYTGSALVINQGAINYYRMSVLVSSDATPTPVNIDVPPSTPASGDNPGCEDGTPVPLAEEECNPQQCGTFTPCSPEPCYCFQVAEGGGQCLQDFFCDTHQDCASSSDCPDGRPCLVNHCCGVGKCGPLECRPGIESPVEDVGFGLTAIGENTK